ncbi:MAG: substrate-binding domain-containing protein [Thermomicrobiales bacterium]|nr:substrate-binding domain-containing protein [Thermomicrobiales bacterium]MCO5220791.1 sugar ABC transporter substrate-binding protein [Thermomicrobiales bacterium]
MNVKGLNRYASLVIAFLLVVGMATSAFAQDARQEAAPAVEHDDSETTVAVVPGGPHPYFAPMEGAIADSQAAFGFGDSTFKSPTEWTLDAQNELISTLQAQGYNAFAIFPGDANGTNSTVEELMDENIPTVLVGGCTSEPSQAQFCIATDVANSAYLATKSLIESMGGEGTIVHLTGFLVDPNTQLRMAAVEQAVAETDGAVTLMQHLADIDSQEEADNKINALLAASASEIDGIVSTAYVPSTVAATALRNLGDKRIKMVGIDDDPIVLDAIREGYLVGTMAQNPYGQAYIAGWALDQLRHSCQMNADSPFLIDSGTFLIDETTVDTYADNLKEITDGIQTSFAENYMDCE